MLFRPTSESVTEFTIPAVEVLQPLVKSNLDIVPSCTTHINLSAYKPYFIRDVVNLKM